MNTVVRREPSHTWSAPRVGSDMVDGRVPPYNIPPVLRRSAFGQQLFAEVRYDSFFVIFSPLAQKSAPGCIASVGIEDEALGKLGEL